MMQSTKLLHIYLDKLCGIITPNTLKTGKVYLFVKDRPTASDEADTVMFAAIIYQGEAQHALYVLETLASLENNREKQICASTDTGLGVEVYALRHRPEHIMFRTDSQRILEINATILADVRKEIHKSISHGVQRFRLVFDNKLEFRSGDAGDIGFVSVTVPMEVLKNIAMGI